LDQSTVRLNLLVALSNPVHFYLDFVERIIGLIWRGSADCSAKIETLLSEMGMELCPKEFGLA
jgi:hypothetical protein